MTDSAQKFIARNRAPRVQIEYDVELYGAEKKVQLPFVMGVMADLVGKSNTPQPAIADRKFLEIDADNFDERMRSMAPRAAFTVPNTLTGEGTLAVDLTFESMTDFTPGAVAAKVDALRPLLEARQQLEQLMTYMDGKAGAEELIETVLRSPSLLSSLAGQGAGPDAEADAALQSLRNAQPASAPEEPGHEDVLTQLAAQAPEDAGTEDAATDVLADLRAAAPTEEPVSDAADSVLSSLAASEPDEVPAKSDHDETLSRLAAAEPSLPEQEDQRGSVLQSLSDQAPEEVSADTAVDDALGTLAAQTPFEADDQDDSEAVLDALSAQEPISAAPESDGSEQVLASLADAEVPEPPRAAGVEEVLQSLEVAETDDDGIDVDDVLSGIEVVNTPTQDDTVDLETVVGALDTAETTPETDVDDVLSGLDPVLETDDEDDARALSDMLDDFGGTETAPETDVSEVLAGLEPVEATSDTAESDLASMLEDVPAATEEAQDNLDDVLAGLEPVEQAADAETADLETVLDQLPVPEAGNESDLGADDILSGLSDIDVGDASPEGDTAVDDILSAIEADAPEQDLETPTADDDLDLDYLLSDLDTHEDEPSDGVVAADPDAAGDQTDTSEDGDADTISADLDTLLDDLDMSEGPSSDEDTSDPILEDLLGDLPDHDAPDGNPEPPHAEDISTIPEDVAETDATEAAETDLDALLADLDESEEADSQNDDLDALFGDLEDAAAAEEEDDLADLDALLGDLDEDAEGDLDLDALLAGDADSETGEEQAASKQPEPELAYGTLSAQRPEPQKLERKRFRLAVFGDFTGRAARGLIDTGDALAQRKPMVLDPDTFEDVIESFATELVLPIGKDGAGISVKLGEFDDLHPDELYDNVTLFSELVGLRKQLQSGTTKDHAMKTLAAWAEAHGTPIRAPKARSGGNAVPADRRLSDFQKLIGDTGNRLREASPVDDMLARVVGPHIRALPDPNLGAMQDAVDLALSDAMRLVLHHPEFQSVEAQWRSLDLIQRSVEVDDTLEVMLYDVSAEEIAADLAAQEDLSQSGFVRLLTEEPMDAENGRGAYSALIGLYTFEETPPHAELLGRFARVAAHVDAPFLASVTPAFWDHPKDERPKLVADAWDTLAGMVEAGHLGLLTPRFLLRRPYGAKGEPIDPFDFEEFTQSEGLRGMLWGNPVVLAAILMAKSFKENGASLQLGSIMSLGDMPYHYVTDRFGDQVALPCTERNVDLDKIAAAKERGFMPIAAVRGRDEIRLTSFNSLRGEALLGPWTGEPAPAPSPADPTPPRPESAPDSTDDDSELDLNFDDDGEGGDDDLDALLAGFGDDDDSDLDGDIDADLEALLNDL